MPFPRRKIASAKPSNVRFVPDQVTWLWNVLTDHNVQSGSLALTLSSNANIICSTAQRWLWFARWSPGIHTLVRTSGKPTGTRITSDPDHKIGGTMMTITVEMTTVTETTTDGDRTTRRKMIMIGMMTIGMTDMIRGIHVMGGETLTEVRAIIEGITTTVNGILLIMIRATQTRPRPTHHHTRPGINHHPSHTQSGLTPATRPQLPVSSAANQGTTPRNAQQQTVERRPL